MKKENLENRVDFQDPQLVLFTHWAISCLTLSSTINKLVFVLSAIH